MTRTTVTNEQIREYLSVAGSSTVASMATHFKCSEVQIHLKADQMVDDGLLERTKLPVPVRKADGTIYARKAVKAYRVRVQGTPGIKTEANVDSLAETHIAALRRILTPEDLAKKGITLPPLKDWHEEFFYEIMGVILGSKNIAENVRNDPDHPRAKVWAQAIQLIRERARPIEEASSHDT